MLIAERDQIRCFQGGGEKSSQGQHMHCPLIVKFDLYVGKARGLSRPFPQSEMSSGIN